MRDKNDGNRMTMRSTSNILVDPKKFIRRATDDAYIDVFE